MRISFAFLLLLTFNAFGQEVCSRVATVNYQEVLVDTNTNKKGEGLRFYLDRDPVAKSYLDKYQEGSGIRIENAIMGTVGTGLVLGGFLSNSNKQRKRVLLASGISMLLVNFLIAKTAEHTNENNLLRAIKEYNKKNLPKIFFQPSAKNSSGIDLMVAKSWEF
ncbi:MAG: hypothetical protein ACO20H_00365 [Bacteriovoracaceae bacterium]